MQAWPMISQGAADVVGGCQLSVISMGAPKGCCIRWWLQNPDVRSSDPLSSPCSPFGALALLLITLLSL